MTENHCPKSFDEFYRDWESKIRTTVRNNTKIAYHEIDDVVQTVFTACIERDWLSKYNSCYAFSTFIYTYVLQEIQNYINKRDSSNTISSSGAPRYTSFGCLFNVDASSIDNFIDRVGYNAGTEAAIDFSAFLDFTEFWEKSKEKFIVTIIKDVSCFDVISFRLNVYMGLVNTSFLESQSDSSIKDFICGFLGISPLDLLKVDTCLGLLVDKSVEAALHYLDEKFL
jgi:hypothetical protein